MEHITNHKERAVKLLFEQFKSSTQLKQLIEALVGDDYSVQELEDEGFKLLNDRMLANAGGVLLDLIGEIIGLSRTDTSDNNYRQAIRTKIAINTSKGTPENLLSLLKQISQSEKVSLIEQYPARIEMWSVDGMNAQNIKQFKNAVSAGVALNVVSSNTDTPFVFYGDDDGEGFGETGGYTDGGNFSELWL